MDGPGSVVEVELTPGARVVRGPGARHGIPDEIARLDARRVLVVATRSARPVADELAGALGVRWAGSFDRPAVHTPVAVTADAMSLVQRVRADAVVAIGGGSAIGLSKAISLRTGLPQVAVPTTYAGSEATPILGETESGVKTTRRDATLVPGTVVYDPELTLGLPEGLTLTSGMNALAHAVEALWADDATPETLDLAAGAVADLLAGLLTVLGSPGDVAARGRLQHGAWRAGRCLALAQMGLHHQLAHVLGALLDLPHAPLHTMLLAPVMDYNLPYAPDAARRLEAITPDPVAAVAALASRYDGARSLADYDVRLGELAAVVERVVASPYPNPRPPDVTSLSGLLRRVHGG